MRTSFDMPVALRKQMEKAREAAGYSSRQKSQWICEAISHLAQLDPTLSTVGLSDGLAPHDTRVPLTLTEDASEAIRQAKHRIRRIDPEAEGLSGQIIRAAIRQRLGNQSHFRTAVSNDQKR